MPLHFSHIARYAPSIQNHIHLKPFAQILTIVMKHPLNQLHPCIINIVSLTIFPESQLYQEVINGTYVEEPEIERLMEMRTLIESLNIRVNLLGHHVSNTVPITGALPDDKAAILREFDKAIAEFPEEELKAYRSRIWHL